MIKRIVLLPDFHHPHQNKPATKAVLQFIEWFKPHTIVILGDGMEMETLNHWQRDKKNRKFLEGKRLKKEYDDFDRDILIPLEKACEKKDKRRKPTRKIYMGGNHEHWVNNLLNKFPEFIGMLDPEGYLHLEERKWEWIPYINKGQRGIVKFGKLIAMHGNYTNKFHAAKTADTYSHSVVYGHTHDCQFYTKVFADDLGYHTACSIGCLCNKAPEFMRGNANRWINAFGVLYVRDDHSYNLYAPIIIKGKFTFANHTFGGK